MFFERVGNVVAEGWKESERAEISSRDKGSHAPLNSDKILTQCDGMAYRHHRVCTEHLDELKQLSSPAPPFLPCLTYRDRLKSWYVVARMLKAI